MPLVVSQSSEKLGSINVRFTEGKAKQMEKKMGTREAPERQREGLREKDGFLFKYFFQHSLVKPTMGE